MAAPGRRTADRSASPRDRVSPLDLSVVRGGDALASIADAWEVLAGELDVVPFLRPRWFQLWWEAFGQGTPTIVVAHRDGRLVGVLPLRTRMGMLLSMSNAHTPWFDAIAVDDEVAGALWSTAIRRARRRLEVVALRERLPGIGALTAAGDRTGRRPWIRNRVSIPYIDIGSTTWDDYTSGLSKNLRKQVRRSARRLEDDGPLRLEIITTADPGALAEVFRIEASGWKGERGTAMASNAATRDFYTRLVQWWAAQGTLRLALLCRGGRAIAFELIVEHGRTWYPLKAGYDDELRSNSPGAVAQWMVLESAFAHGLERYDYSGEALEYTSRWTDTAGGSFRVGTFTPVVGSLDRLALTVGRPLAKRVRGRRKR